jgi:hypothetical protein
VSSGLTTCKVLDYTTGLVPPADPLFIASNGTVSVGSLALVLAPAPSSDECNESCMPPSGHYPLLQVNTGLPVPPDASPTELEAGNGSTYLVVNERSGIDSSCDPMVRWYATQVPEK